MVNELVINLDTVRTSPESRVFSGRPRGEWCREHFKLDAADTAGAAVRIIIPKGTYSVNMSFFLGLLGRSVRHYGNKEGFYKHYKFECEEFHWESIHAGVEQALKESNVLKISA